MLHQVLQVYTYHQAQTYPKSIVINSEDVSVGGSYCIKWSQVSTLAAHYRNKHHMININELYINKIRIVSLLCMLLRPPSGKTNGQKYLINQRLFRQLQME